MLGICRTVFFFLTLFLCLASLLLDDLKLLFLSIVTILAHNVIYSFEHPRKRMVFLAFQITFSTFMLSKIMLGLIRGRGYNLPFDLDIIKHIFIVLLLSLLFIFIGYLFAEHGQNDQTLSNELPKTDDDKRRLIRNISKWLYYLAYLPNLAVLLERALFVRQNSYLSYFTDFQSRLPFGISKIGEMAAISFFVFLGTMPSKKECKRPVLLYFLSGIISLGSGQRNQFVLSILIIGIYYFLRNTINSNNEKWIGKKTIITSMIAMPFFVAFLGIYAYIRQGMTINNLSFLRAIYDFFNNQGESVLLLGYAEKFKDSFPGDTLYTFGPIMDFLKNNVFNVFLNNASQLKTNTMDMALQGNSFGQTIAYLVMPAKYLTGAGLGSSYIAEVYFDFGYMGVCIINFIYGFIFGTVYTFYRRNSIWIFAIGFMMIQELLYAPRDTALGFITTSLNLINILTLLVIFITYKLWINVKGKGTGLG